MTLRRIRIRNLGVIEDAELELVDGLNVITGETGAGKTMVVSGLGLLLGARADAGRVRDGADQAVVEGEVDVPPDHPAALRVAEAGGDVEDGVLLARTVSASGRSRAHVGGRTAPVGVLADVGEHLVAVHGQADQWRLRDAEQHRVLLDHAGGEPVAAAATAYQQVYDEWKAGRARLAELGRTSAERTRRVAMLRAALEEIEAVDPREGEEDELRAESDRLTYAEDLRGAARTAHDALVGGDDLGDETSVASLVGAASSALDLVGEHDPALAALRVRVDELGYLASDLGSELASYVSGVDVDPERLDAVHTRRAELGRLLRTYGPTTGEVLAWASASAAELAQIDVSDEELARLRDEVRDLGRQVAERGAALTAARRAAADALQQQVTEELSHLAMGAATLVVAVTPLAAGEGSTGAGTAGAPVDDTVELADGTRVRPRRHGMDDVEIQLAANVGAAPRSVQRAASGGELSRVMLALEIAAGHGDVPTYVFDEVDAGVGGSAALDLGARLARLARDAQVVVVTHLGQVAAYADRHLVVRKSTDGQVTSSGVAIVEGADREQELARMLGGVSDSDAALEHARELLARRASMEG